MPQWTPLFNTLTGNSFLLNVSHKDSSISKCAEGKFRTGYCSKSTFSIEDNHKIWCTCSIWPVSSIPLLFQVGAGKTLNYSEWPISHVFHSLSLFPLTAWYGTQCHTLCFGTLFTLKIQCYQYQFCFFKVLIKCTSIFYSIK